MIETRSNQPTWACSDWANPGHYHGDCEDCRLSHMQCRRFTTDAELSDADFDDEDAK